MKKLIYGVAAIALISFSSCGKGYSEEAGKAAQTFCDCAEDKKIEDIKENPSAAMELYGCLSDALKYAGDDKEKGDEMEKAIKDKCPDIYDAIEKMK